MDFKRGGLLFVILKSGEGACHCGQLQRQLGSGGVLVADGASGCKIHALGDGELVLWFFQAECEHLFPLFSSREISLLRKVAESLKAGKVYPGSSLLAKECLRLAEEAPGQLSLEHRTQVLRIVSAILTAEFKAVQPEQAGFLPAQSHAIQVLERLKTSELLSLPIGELAKKFHCSRRHLNRLFRKHWGLPVAALRMEMRLLKAASLLADPHAKIYGVAAQCGFNHMGPFNSCFKRRFGASPSRWRTRGADEKNQDAASDLRRVSCPMLTNGMCPWHKTDLEHFAIVPGRSLKWKG